MQDQNNAAFDPSQLPPRFASKIAVDESGCWVWMGSRMPFGYGQCKRNRQTECVHRTTYELLSGPIPDGLELDHVCRNPPCCNPAHLEAVTHKVNMERGYWGLRTHCPSGHEYTPENTYYYAQGHRRCKECHRERERSLYVPKEPRARKSHCKHGHEFTPENTRLKPDGSRVCKACHRNEEVARHHRLHPKAPYKRAS